MQFISYEMSCIQKIQQRNFQTCNIYSLLLDVRCLRPPQGPAEIVLVIKVIPQYILVDLYYGTTGSRGIRYFCPTYGASI